MLVGLGVGSFEAAGGFCAPKSGSDEEGIVELLNEAIGGRIGVGA